MKLGDCLSICQSHWVVSGAHCGRRMKVPMCQARHNLSLDISLYFIPFLAMLWWARGEQLAEVTRLDRGYHLAIRKGVIVIRNYIDL